MFSRIARRYDLANRLLSGGVDRSWRRRLVHEVRQRTPRAVLDLATGSGDVAFALARGLPASVGIVGMDFCQPMLDEAETKKRAGGLQYSNVTFGQGDALALPQPAETFDAVTIAFGLRNLGDRNRGLREMHRVLKPGGHLYVLEFSQPQQWFRPFYYFYLRRLLPAAAGIVTGDKAAYVYLNETISDFPGHRALAAEIGAAGFTAVQAHRLTFGIVALHIARK